MAGTNGTYEMSVLFEFVVPGVLLNCVGILGLIGNTLSIIVLSRPQMKSSINCILIGNLIDFHRFDSSFYVLIWKRRYFRQDPKQAFIIKTAEA